MSLEKNLGAITVEAGGDLSAGQYLFVQLASDGQVDLVASAGGDAIGVLLNDPDAAGKAAEVQILGVAKVKVGSGGLTAGHKVQSDASGQAITAASGDHVLGRAMHTAVEGDIASVLLVNHHILA